MKKRRYTKPIIESSQIESDTFLSSSTDHLQEIKVYTNRKGNGIQLGKENDFIFQEDEDLPDADFFIPNETEY